MAYEYLQGPPLQMVFQVQNQMIDRVQNYSSIPIYDGGDTYITPIEAWINESCQSNPPAWIKQYQGFMTPAVIGFLSPTQMKILLRTQYIIDEILSWIISKDKGKSSGMNDLLSLLHWWYDFT